MTRAIVTVSGGVASGAAWIIATRQYGSVVPVFCDTKSEHRDLYRFIDDMERKLGPVIRITDGRNIWQVMKDVRFLGNSRVDPCSRILKREAFQAWVKDNCNTDNDILVFGYTHDEPKRAERTAAAWAPYRVHCPLSRTDGLPPIGKSEAIGIVRSIGVEPCIMYEQGFSHANCRGGCIKMGQSGFAHLLRTDRAAFDWWSNGEQEMRGALGKNVAILRDRRGGGTKPLTLDEFRRRIEDGGESSIDECSLDHSCSCFSGAEQETIDFYSAALAEAAGMEEP